MTDPYISVIVPVFNEEKFVSRCLESVIRQTFNNIEVIVINDASSDNSRMVIDEFLVKDKRVKCIEHDLNKGLGEARNTGVKVSHGKYVFFLDSDDYLPLDSLETLCEIAANNNNDIIFGKTKSNIAVDDAFIFQEIRNSNIDNHMSLVYNHSAWNKLIKREFILNRKLKFIEPRYAEDIMFSIRSNFYAESISITTKFTYNYNWDRQYKTVNHQKIIDARDNLFKAYKFISDNGNPFLIDEMSKKTMRYVYAMMVRVTRAYNKKEVYNYMMWWQPFLNEVKPSLYNAIPQNQRKFCKLITENRFDEALKLWKKNESSRILANNKSIRYLLKIKKILIKLIR